MDLPQFKYHPDPVTTGSIEARIARCICCDEIRHYMYVGPVYAEAHIGDVICPWCISSGLAHEKLDAEFVDIEGVGDSDPTSRESAPQPVREEVAYRTPGFSGWQQERWLVHCGDACMFLGPAGKSEVYALNSQELLDSLRTDMEMNEEEFRPYLDALDKNGMPTAYIFRCLHCGKYLGYSDST